MPLLTRTLHACIRRTALKKCLKFHVQLPEFKNLVRKTVGNMGLFPQTGELAHTYKTFVIHAIEMQMYG